MQRSPPTLKRTYRRSSCLLNPPAWINFFNSLLNCADKCRIAILYNSSWWLFLLVGKILGKPLWMSSASSENLSIENASSRKYLMLISNLIDFVFPSAIYILFACISIYYKNQDLTYSITSSFAKSNIDLQNLSLSA